MPGGVSQNESDEVGWDDASLHCCSLPSELYEPYFFVILSKWPYHATFSKLLRSVFDFYLDAHVMLTPKECTCTDISFHAAG